MRKITLVVCAALTLGACTDDTAAPTDSALEFGNAADLAFSGSFAGDPRGNFLGPLHRLPDNLKLSAAQEAAVKALVEQFAQAVKSDHEALSAIMQQARAAHQAGKSREEIKVILDQALPIRERLIAAETKLRADIFALLTAEQKAWLEANRPTRCTAPALSDEQKSQVSSLFAAFQQANSADLSAIKSAMDRARAARRNGASREEIHAILESVRPAMMRVALAERALRVAIAGILTPEQLACFSAPGGKRG